MGIDYGLGTTNIDKATGIRFGVIPAGNLSEWIYEALELVYPDPCCPKCGRDAQDMIDAENNWNAAHADEIEAGELSDELTQYCGGSCDDYGCGVCGIYFGSDDLGDIEPIAQKLEDGEYKVYGSAGSYASSDDLFVELSPYYTFAPFCSPCAPGAVYLRDAGPAGDARGYCFGHEWFTGGVAPYPVYSVVDDSEVYPVGLSF